MNNRNETPPSTLGRIKKTTKPSGSAKKSGVFDFYDALDETARLTSDTTPNLNAPSSEEIPNLHEEASSPPPPSTEKERKSTLPSSPLRRSYLQSNRQPHTRYGTFKYQYRPTQPASGKDPQATDNASPSLSQYATITPEDKPSTNSSNPSQKKYPTNQDNQDNPTPKQNPKPETQEAPYNPMNTTLHTPPTQSSRPTDFRDNVRRQVNEQKSIGRILTLISISFAALIIISFSLAAYGGYVMWNRLNEQSSTIADVENKFSKRLSTLQASLDRLQIDLHKTQKYSDELARQNQELTRALREQQELTRRTKAQVDTLSNQIRQEKALREQQLRDLSRDLARNSSLRALPVTAAAPVTPRAADRPAAPSSITPVRR